MFPLLILQPIYFNNSEGRKRKMKFSLLDMRLDWALLPHHLDPRIRERVRGCSSVGTTDKACS